MKARERRMLKRRASYGAFRCVDCRVRSAVYVEKYGTLRCGVCGSTNIREVAR